MKFKEFSFVAYSISDVKKSRTFYEKVLGLKPISIYDGGNSVFIEYKVGQDTLAIGKGAPNFKSGKTGATVALELVGNFDTAIKELKKKKIKFIMEKYDGPVCNMVIVEDPSGNQIMIHKRKG